jgi:hypothetical protein
MRPILAIALFVLGLPTQQPLMALAQSGPASPDFDLAYVLATASYCAYAVGEADADGGQQRAVECLKAAAKADDAQLDVFRDVKQENVETLFDPTAPENAYLLIQIPTAVILAFRGTLTPPISPSSDGFPQAATAALAKYKAREATLLITFINDWKNNLIAVPNARDRHSGFDAAWDGLLAYLMARKCAPSGCSKFLSFVGQLRNTPSQRLYITGHSKGGALATLAVLDLPGLLGGDIIPVVYTFSGAKALAADGAERDGHASKDMWRFEHEYDIVPSVPPDRTVLPWPAPAYAHLGSRAFFAKGKPAQLSQPAGGVDEPGDKVRLTAAVRNLFPSSALTFNPVNLVTSILSLGEVNCRALVDTHFRVFSDLQELVRARHAGAPTTITEENLDRSFFYTGLPDDKGEILWGYSQWCSLLTAASSK